MRELRCLLNRKLIETNEEAAAAESVSLEPNYSSISALKSVPSSSTFAAAAARSLPPAGAFGYTLQSLVLRHKLAGRFKVQLDRVG